VTEQTFSSSLGRVSHDTSSKAGLVFHDGFMASLGGEDAIWIK
jgi:hypothetical protein